MTQLRQRPSQSANGHAIEVLKADLYHERELRERLEHAVDQRFLAQERALDVASTASEKALALSAVEVERRLNILNGEQARHALVLAQSVPREVWEQGEKAREAWQHAIERDIAELRVSRGVKQGEGQQSAKLVVYAFLVLALLQVVLTFWG